MCQHLSDLLRLLTCECNKQRAARCCRISPFQLIKPSTFLAWGLCMMRKHIPSSMDRYNCTAVRYHRGAQRLLCMAWPKTSWKPSVAHQCTALLTLFQIAICCLWRQTTLIKDVFHSVIYTINRSLSGKQAKFEVCILHMQIAQSRNCTLVIIMQSWDSENAQCNLEIAQFPDCAEHK